MLFETTVKENKQGTVCQIEKWPNVPVSICKKVVILKMCPKLELIRYKVIFRSGPQMPSLDTRPKDPDRTGAGSASLILVLGQSNMT